MPRSVKTPFCIYSNCSDAFCFLSLLPFKCPFNLSQHGFFLFLDQALSLVAEAFQSWNGAAFPLRLGPRTQLAQKDEDKTIYNHIKKGPEVAQTPISLHFHLHLAA